MGHFESFQQAMGQKAVPSPLVPGPGLIRAEDGGTEYKQPDDEGAWGWTPVWLVRI